MTPGTTTRAPSFASFASFVSCPAFLQSARAIGAAAPGQSLRACGLWVEQASSVNLAFRGPFSGHQLINSFVCGATGPKPLSEALRVRVRNHLSTPKASPGHRWLIELQKLVQKLQKRRRSGARRSKARWCTQFLDSHLGKA